MFGLACFRATQRRQQEGAACACMHDPTLQTMNSNKASLALLMSGPACHHPGHHTLLSTPGQAMVGSQQTHMRNPQSGDSESMVSLRRAKPRISTPY